MGQQSIALLLLQLILPRRLSPSGHRQLQGLALLKAAVCQHWTGQVINLGN